MRHARKDRAATCVAAVISCLTVASSLRPQGATSYFNVESPQVKAIAVATVNGHDYLLVCNTPDNAVEVYDTVGNVLVASVRTGAEPISVTWDAATSRLYTADFLGDSVTAVELVPSASGPPAAILRRCEWVGDEPMHVAVLPGGILAVTLGSMSALALVHPLTLQPVFGTSLDLLDDYANPTRAVKDPRTIFAAGPLVVVLGHRGGKSGLSIGDPYDFDLWTMNLATGAVTTLGGLGTLHFNMQLARNGDVFVVGTDAQLALVGEVAARTAPTGFVQTALYRVRGLGGTSPQVLARDLGRQTTASGQLGNPVLPQESLAQVTDVAVFEPDASTQKVYLAAFHVDRVGVVDARGSQPNAWPILARIGISPISGVQNGMAGPRALAVKYPRAGVAGDPGARVYCLNRLDNSVSVIDPITDTLVATFPLRFDPTPLHIKNGRKFLYDARLSGNGFVSCASCHQDGRADFLLWDLSDGVTVPFNPALNGGISAPPSNPTWPGNKGRLMTQSLQGMLNAEVDGRAQPFFTNEPLHWRADRRTFEDFNGAFPNLLGGAPLGTAEMAAFRAFIMSIHYPPNPEQDLTRRPRGVFGTPDALDGSGAARGLKLSAIRALTSTSAGGTLAAGRSCIQCHEPPEGSENLVTMFDTSRSTPGVLQPLETTQVRMTRHKERRFEKGPAGLSTIRTGMFGIGHEGGLDSINDFTDGTFGRSFPGSGEVRDVIQLFREWDSGTGPLVGRPVTVDIGNRSAAVGLLAFYEAQAAQANCGVAVHGRIAGAPRGFWFDLAGAAPVYREEPSGATFTRAALLAQLATADDVLVFTAVPLGSERRFATLSPSPPPPLLGPSPSSLTLEPMPASPFWQDLPRLTFNWDIVGPSPFRWLSTQPEPRILRTKRIAQKGLVTDGAGLNLGITAPRHEAPRRLAVAGDGIRHGASLVLFLPLDPASPPPPALQPPFTWLWLPIHPTERRNASGRQVWETHVELEPLTAYTLMLGGHAAPNVAALLNGTFAQEPPAVGTFAPGAWNRYWIAVVNTDGTFGLTFGERVRMQ